MYQTGAGSYDITIPLNTPSIGFGLIQVMFQLINWVTGRILPPVMIVEHPHGLHFQRLVQIIFQLVIVIQIPAVVRI